MAKLLDTLTLYADYNDFELSHSTGLRHTIAILLFSLARWILGREFEIVFHLEWTDDDNKESK